MEELSPGAVVAGHRIEELVARGGMGVVYRVTHLELERERALKLIAPELAADEDFRSRSRREWKLAASIDHPHALPIYDAGEADGLLYIAMRYVPGTDLKELSREGPLDPEFAATVIAQVAGALDAAHARGLVHRDIKPANILVEDRNGEPHAYLTDFGLTKNLASTVQLTNEGRWVGTVNYVAPEQIEGDRVDARTDIYGLGCVAYQCLAGTVPFPRDSDVATIWAHLNQDPPSLQERRPNLPAELDAVVQRAMAKAPDDRFPSAGDFGRALGAATRGEEYGGGERSVARGGAGAERRRRPIPRDLRRVASIGVVLAVVLAVAVVAIVLSGGKDTTGAKPARQELVAFQQRVGGICDDYDRDLRAASRRAPSYRKKLKKARNLTELRNVIVDERQYGIRSASNQSARLAGLQATSDELESTRRQTVSRWRTNLSKLRAYRDRLKRTATYDDLVKVTNDYDGHERTQIQERNDRIVAGLLRLGGTSCSIDEEPAIGAIPLPPDPDDKGGGEGADVVQGSDSSDGGGTGSTGTGGGATSGGATSGGATSGGATSGGATSGGSTSGGATSTSTSGGGTSTSGATGGSGGGQ